MLRGRFLRTGNQNEQKGTTSATSTLEKKSSTFKKMKQRINKIPVKLYNPAPCIVLDSSILHARPVNYLIFDSKTNLSLSGLNGEHIPNWIFRDFLCEDTLLQDLPCFKPKPHLFHKKINKEMHKPPTVPFTSDG